MKYLTTLLTISVITLVAGCSNQPRAKDTMSLKDNQASYTSPYIYKQANASNSIPDEIERFSKNEDEVVSEYDDELIYLATPTNGYIVTQTSSDEKEYLITPSANREYYSALEQKCLSVGGKIVSKHLQNGMTNFSCNKAIDDKSQPLHDPR